MYRKQKSLSHTWRPNSYWIIGEQQASEWESTAKRYIYSQVAAVRVRWLSPTPTPKKLAGSASISGMVSGKRGVDMSTPVHPVATPLHVILHAPANFRGNRIRTNIGGLLTSYRFFKMAVIESKSTSEFRFSDSIRPKW